METKDLLQLVEKFRQSRTYITNEETAKMALIVPFLRLLGYDRLPADGVKLIDRAVAEKLPVSTALTNRSIEVSVSMSLSFIP